MRKHLSLFFVVALTALVPLFAREAGRGGSEMNRGKSGEYKKGQGNKNYHPQYNNARHNMNQEENWNAAKKGFGAGYESGQNNQNGTNVYVNPDNENQSDELYQQDLQNNQGQ